MRLVARSNACSRTLKHMQMQTQMHAVAQSNARSFHTQMHAVCTLKCMQWYTQTHVVVNLINWMHAIIHSNACSWTFSRTLKYTRSYTQTHAVAHSNACLVAHSRILKPHAVAHSNTCNRTFSHTQSYTQTHAVVHLLNFHPDVTRMSPGFSFSSLSLARLATLFKLESLEKHILLFFLLHT